MRVLCIKGQSPSRGMFVVEGEIYEADLVMSSVGINFYEINGGFFYEDRFVDISIIRDEKINQILK